jgi:hypothetical protein
MIHLFIIMLTFFYRMLINTKDMSAKLSIPDLELDVVIVIDEYDRQVCLIVSPSISSIYHRKSFSGFIKSGIFFAVSYEFS